MSMRIYFTELLDVVSPTEYEKETWQMTEDEKLNSIPNLREKGNTQFKEKDYKAATDTYASAIGMLEQLMLKYDLISLYERV